MFNKIILQHECYYQKENETIIFNYNLRDLLFGEHTQSYKTATELLTVFMEIKLNEDNSNYVFHRLIKLIHNVDHKYLQHFDRLFGDFLCKFQNQIKRNAVFISNITKLCDYHKEKHFGKHIDFILNEGLRCSRKRTLELQNSRKYKRKIMYTRIAFISCLMMLFLTISKMF